MTEKPLILLIEDEANTQDIISRKLQKRGYDTQAFGNGQDALDWVTNGGKPDVVLMDIELPGINGIETTKYLRTIDSIASTPIIAVSANIDYRQKADLDQAGFDMYCLKPLDYDKLFRMITSCLQKRQQKTQVGA